MKRNSGFAVAVLLILLLALVGSWVYLNNNPWPFAAEKTTASADEPTGGPAKDVAQDVFVEFGDGPDYTSGGEEWRRKPLETPTDPRPEPVRRATPPDPVRTSETTKVETTNAAAKDEIVAEFAPGVARVAGDGESTDGLESFIVSTLRSASARVSQFKTKAFDPKGDFSSAIVPKSRIDKWLGQVPEIENVLVGRLIWPSLPKDQLAAVKDEHRRQAVVYLEKLYELRAVVDSDEGWFFLEVTDTLAAEFKKKGLRIVVHSPAFQISGGFESIDVKESDGAIKINLEVTPVIEVVVNVTPPEAVAAGVRVWVERWGMPLTPDYDDSLYMSATVPASGRLIFSVPEHYGYFRVAATGEAWHSGLPQVLDLGKWKTTRVDVNLTLAHERCDLVTGEVTTPSGEVPVAGARLECTHFGTTVYTDPKGAFRMYVPWDRFEGERQFLVSGTDLRPEVAPLESGRTGSPGVTGEGPVGPFSVKLAASVVVDLALPKGAATGTLMIDTRTEITPERDKAKGVTIRWGTSLIYIRDGNGKLQSLYIEPRLWFEVSAYYGAGIENKSLETQLFEEAFKKR